MSKVESVSSHVFLEENVINAQMVCFNFAYLDVDALTSGGRSQAQRIHFVVQLQLIGGQFMLRSLADNTLQMLRV